MKNSSDSGSSSSDTSAQFGLTHWTSVIGPAADGNAQAREELCRAYWYPLYAFLRRQYRKSPHEAQDLVQGFFLHLLAKDSRLRSVNPAKGRFRSFLLVCLKNYVADRRNWEQVRAPAQPLLSIDEVLAEERYHLEPADGTDPERIYLRVWARTVLEQTLVRLRNQYVAKGKSELFDALSPHLTAEAKRGDHAVIAARLGMNEGAVRTAASRLLEAYRQELRAEIRRTVEDPGDVDAEIRSLFSLSAG